MNNLCILNNKFINGLYDSILYNDNLENINVCYKLNSEYNLKLININNLIIDKLQHNKNLSKELLYYNNYFTTIKNNMEYNTELKTNKFLMYEEDFKPDYNSNIIDAANITINKIVNEVVSDLVNKTVYENEVDKLSDQNKTVDQVILDKVVDQDKTVDQDKVVDQNKTVEQNKVVNQDKFNMICSLLNVESKKFIESLTIYQIADIFETVYQLRNVKDVKDVKDTDKENQSDQENEYKEEQKIISTTDIKTSALIGKEAEIHFEQICSRLPIDYKIHNVSKQAKQGDFVIELSADNTIYRCLVDIKKYKTSVPTAQIKKFIEDLSYGNYNAGILISVNSKFTGISNYIHLDTHPTLTGSIPLLYLAEIPDEFYIKCIEMLFAKTRINKSRQTDVNKIENIVSSINSSMQTSSIIRRNLTDMKNTVSTQINNCLSDLLQLECNIKISLDEIIRSLSFTDVNNTNNTDENIDKKYIDRTTDENIDKNFKIETKNILTKSIKTSNKVTVKKVSNKSEANKSKIIKSEENTPTKSSESTPVKSNKTIKIKETTPVKKVKKLKN
jgi:hypothetical protein